MDLGIRIYTAHNDKKYGDKQWNFKSDKKGLFHGEMILRNPRSCWFYRFLDFAIYTVAVSVNPKFPDINTRSFVVKSPDFT